MKLNIIKRSINSNILIALCFMMILSSCGVHKNDMGQKRLPKLKESKFIAKLDSMSKQKPDFFYAKLNMKYENGDQKLSFKTSVRVKVDSAMQAIISYANFPIYSAIISPDSLTLLDRRNDCFISENLKTLQQYFNVNLNYNNIEELLMGMPIGWNNKIDYDKVNNPYQFELFSDVDGDEEYMYRYFLDDKAQHIERTIIESKKDSIIVEVLYSNYKKIEDYFVPSKGMMTIYAPKNTQTIEFKYNKTSINEPRILYLSIPKQYVQCD